MTDIDVSKIKLLDNVSMEQDLRGSYLDQMLKGKAIWPKRTLPGWPNPIRIRPLGRGTELECHGKAQSYVTHKGLDLSIEANKNLADELSALMILYEAIVTVDSTIENVERIASSFEQFQEHPALNDSAITFLWKEYEDIKGRLSPSFDNLPQEVQLELLAELKKNPTPTSMEHLPRRWIEALLISLVQDPAILIGSSSPTTDS
jgi:hypothetical protein